MKKKRIAITSFAMGILFCFMMSLMVVPGFAALVSKTITVYTGITLYYDGVKVNPKDASGKKVEPLLYNGTTYLPVRAVSELFGEDINWDGNTKSVYIGTMPGKTTYLWYDVPAYDKSSCYERPTIKMDGKTYTNGIEIDNYALFNLDGRYDTLEFDVGHKDSVWLDKELLIYLDGQLVRTVEIKAEELVKHVRIPLNGALQLKLVASSSSYNIGIANAELY